MTPERYRQCEETGAGLTSQEIYEGWHWCWDWDLMLVGPGMPELECCTCDLPQEKNSC